MYLLRQLCLLLIFAQPLSAQQSLLAYPSVADEPANRASDPHKFNLEAPVADFDLMIEKFFEFKASSNSNRTAKIGGFVFFPFQEQLISSESGAITIRHGLKVYLAYYKKNAAGKRVIEIRGFEDSSTNLDVSAMSGLYDEHGFILVSDNPDPFMPADKVIFSEIENMDLSYLAIDDYNYLAKDTSYYPSSQLATDFEQITEERSLIIQRALVGQNFDIVNQDSTDITRYRTLSFRPVPLPSYSSNEETVMAFKYGYYCPPYWGQDENASSLTGALFFRDQGPDQFDQDSLSGDALKHALGGFLNDQLAKRNRVIEDFGEPRSNFFEFLNKLLPTYWYVFALLILIIGFLIGRFFVPAAEPTN